MASRQRVTEDRVERAARERLGLDHLRSGQREALQAALDGHDVLAVFPSGYGKSAIYQVAGTLLPGLTVVISPLIALQEDQVQAIDQQASGGAILINSSVAAGERAAALDAIDHGDVEFVLLAPEQLANDETLEHLKRAAPSLVVVDEAHCIVSWGHDFRPDYALLGGVIAALGHPRVIALTATAAPPVQDEIVERLGLRSPRVILRGLDRPNIYLRVQRFDDEPSKTAALLDAVEASARPGIVYVATRARAEELADALIQRDIRAAPYHAGLPARQRQDTQDAFMSGEVDVIVATTAFGMGVDKPDIRFVFHYDVSDSLDSYYQEIGRAGRDGSPAYATLFYRPEDLGIRRYFASGSGIDEDELDAILDAIGNGEERKLEEVAARLEMSMPRLLRAVNLLEGVGALAVVDARTVRRLRAGNKGATERATEEHDQQEQFEQTRVAMMQRYAEQSGCRRTALLAYFGEEYEPPCDSCDNCDSGLPAPDNPSSDAQAWAAAGADVVHQKFGPGQIIQANGDRVVVLFEDAGYRVIDLGAAPGLLQPR